MSVFPEGLPVSMRVVEVGLRDGLQTTRDFVPTTTKLRLVDLVLEAGVRDLEVTSFAHPAVLPQFADAETMVRSLPAVPGAVFRCLVPNLRGAQRALDCGATTLTFLLPASDEGGRGNQGRSQERLLEELHSTVVLADEAGADVVVAIAAAFFAVGIGTVSPDLVIALVDSVVGLGARAVYLADSLGMANPAQVHGLVAAVKARHPGTPVGLHLHTRNGFAIANVLGGLLAGADWFESAFAGLGGDLWLPGHPDVLGNLATEDLLAFAGALGIDTGVDSRRYAAVTALASRAGGRAALDHVTRGGTVGELAALDWDSMVRDFEGMTTTRGKDAT